MQTRKTKKYTTYRKTLAWIGFITVYLGIPAVIFTTFYFKGLSDQCMERTEPFYQQTATN